VLLPLRKKATSYNQRNTTSRREGATSTSTWVMALGQKISLQIEAGYNPKVS
jgi:hypothetical protein